MTTTQQIYDIRAALASYIDVSFINDTEFLQHFCGNLGAPELVECYIGHHRTRLVIRCSVWHTDKHND